MKEEYLEEYEYACEEEEPAMHLQTEEQRPQQKPTMDFYPIKPNDFDGDNDDAMLRKILNKFQMNFLYPFLKAYDITYRSLRYLCVDDINAAIRSVGHRAEFREKLFSWRRKRYRTNDIIIECEKPALNLANATNTAIKVHNTIDRNTTQNRNIQNEIQTIANITSFQDVVKSMKRAASNVDSYSVLDAIDELPHDIEMNEHETKRIKSETLLDLREHSLAIQMSLEDIVNDSVFGPILKAFYDKNGYLERKHRDELIQAIIDYVITNEIKLHSSDFSKIVNMIVNIFPAEDEARDYYFINRKGKRNPMGRLYTKYYNTLKRMRVRDIHHEFTQESSSYMQTPATQSDEMTSLTTIATASSSKLRPTNGINANDANNISNSCNNNNGSNNNKDNTNDGSISSNTTQIELIEDEFEELIQLDDTSVSAIKNFLRCQGLNWDDVKTMWSKTYLSRQEDVEHSTIKDVLLQWPKYLNERGMELFDIDFRLKFSRNKANILKRKWPAFVQKVSQYYQTNIRDEMCKGLYALWKARPGKDTEDYINTVLLNAIMIPMARYRDALGNRRKVSIVEAVDLFAVRVNHLEELDLKREEFSIKFGDMHTDFTPLIVVVGDNNINIHEIYVHFDVALYEMPDFLSAMDCCMKIYRVLNLPYPASNEYVWTFIQRYFYEIILPDDIKCPSMSSLISYLKF